MKKLGIIEHLCSNQAWISKLVLSKTDFIFRDPRSLTDIYLPYILTNEPRPKHTFAHKYICIKSDIFFSNDKTK